MQKTLLILCLYLTICSQSVAAGMQEMDPVVQLEAKSEELLASIRHIIGKAACQHNSQCKTLPIGHRACGGPADYLAYSSLNTDVQKLKELAKQHTETRKEINRIQQAISTCEMLMPPPVSCRSGKCEVR